MFLTQKGHVPMVGQEQAVPAGSGAVPPGGAQPGPHHGLEGGIPSSALAAVLGKPELTRTSFSVLRLALYYGLVLPCAQL